MSEWIARNRGAKQEPLESLSVDDREWVAAHPALHDFMSLPRLPDGAMRETASLIIFVEAGLYKCCFNDKDEGRVAFVTAATPLSLLAALERKLETGDMDWRTSRAPRPGRKG